MKNGYEKITKKQFYELGGFSNPNIFRKANKNGGYSYYIKH